MDECRENLKNKLEMICCLCGEKMTETEEIGSYCPNEKCDNGDGPSVWDVIQKSNYFYIGAVFNATKKLKKRKEIRENGNR